jgi:hypothetical protein
MAMRMSRYTGLHDAVTMLIKSRIAALAVAAASAWVAMILGPNGIDAGESNAGGIIVGRRYPQAIFKKASPPVRESPANVSQRALRPRGRHSPWSSTSLPRVAGQQSGTA